MYSRLLLPLLAGLAAGFMAYKRGRDVLFWGLASAIFPPLMLLLFFLPPRFVQGRNRKCPSCGRVVGKDDAVCRYCGKEMPIELVQCPNCGSFVPDKPYCMQCNRKIGN